MKKHLIYSIILLVAASCASFPPIVKLTPSTLENKDYWDMGQQFVYTDNKDIWFDCAYSRVENGKLIFDVKITNVSDHPVLIDPTQFQQKIYKNDTLLLGSFHADNPEKVLDELKLIENESIAHAKRLSVISICSFAIYAGTLLTAPFTDYENEKTLDKRNALTLGSGLAHIAAGVSSDVRSIRAEKNRLKHLNMSEIFLRKTTLPKGYYIDGEIHFPYNNKAKWYDLQFKVGDASAYFYFKQELIRSLDQIQKK